MMPLMLIMMRQLVEQKQKQKRQIPGMVHASDSRPQTARGWRGKEESKPLMSGYSVHRNNQGVVLCYDGPLQYTMSPNNPDAMPSIQVNSQLSKTSGNEEKEASPKPEVLQTKLEALNLSSHVDFDASDDEDIDISPVESLSSPEADPGPSSIETRSSENTVIRNGRPPLQRQDSSTGSDTPKLQSLEMDDCLGKLENFLEDLPAFATEPCPQGVTVRCRIARDKKGMDRGMFPHLLFALGEAGRQKGVLARSPEEEKICNIQLFDISRCNRFIQRRSNLLGTVFTVYDAGFNPKKRISTEKDSRCEIALIYYETNVLGFKGPRKMSVVLPALNNDHKRIEMKSSAEGEGILEKVKSRKMENLLELQNKTPQWNDETQSYVLNFHGRVTQASVKNFQIVHINDPDYIVMQFGRVSDDVFTMDYGYPMCALQAFAIALSSLDSKLACE